MHEKTECKFSYKPIRKGRSFKEIEFELEPIAKIICLEDTDLSQVTLDQILEEQEDTETHNKELWQSAIKEFNFTLEQLEEIRSVLVTIPDSKLPEDITTYTNDIQFRRYHYIQQQMLLLKRRDREQTIKNKFAYFVKMIKTDSKAE